MVVSSLTLTSSQVSIVDAHRGILVIQQATIQYPNDAALWNKRLSLLIDESAETETIKEEFQLACKNSPVKVNDHFSSFLPSRCHSRIPL
jgi:hypothetical protein